MIPFGLQLEEASKAGKPLQVAAARERALVDGLHALANVTGFNMQPIRGINANGELNIYGAQKPMSDAGSQPFGESFAALISMIPRRTGATPTKVPALPENAWCTINHFDAERLIKLVAAGEHLRLKAFKDAPKREAESPCP